MREALTALERFARQADAAAVATVVATAGSTYRRAGARMVLTASGATVGAVSGGCLESDLMTICRESLFAGGSARLVLYDTSATEEMVWGLNMGCNGRVEVLLEPAPAPDDLVIARLAAELAEGRTVSLITGLDPLAPGRRLLLCEDGESSGSLGSGSLDQMALAAAGKLLDQHSCGALLLGGEGARLSAPGEEAGPGEVRLFAERIAPAPRLFVFGAGHDAAPLVEMAGRVGWNVAVVDHRPAMLDRSRFPLASQLIRAYAAEAVAGSGMTAADYCIVMTHNYGNDQALLASLLELEPAHIGLLGPRARTEQLLGDLAKAGVTPSPAAVQVMAAPLGLDVGGETPEEIALSAVAELQAVRHGRSGGRLRLRTEPIHAQSERALVRS
jgi:xanthine dehydrogenase accessory factor